MTIVHDIPACHKFKRIVVVAFFIIVGAAFSTMYTSNVGYTHRQMAGSSTDYHYALLAFFSFVGASWVNKFNQTCEKFSRKSTMALVLGYWIPLFATSFVHFVDSSLLMWAFVAMFGWLIVYFVLLKCYMNSKGFRLGNMHYFEEFLCYGAMPLFTDIVRLSHSIDNESRTVRALKLWWGFSSKFFIPWILWHLVLLLDVGAYFG